jgi:hypothetical protein
MITAFHSFGKLKMITNRNAEKGVCNETLSDHVLLAILYTIYIYIYVCTRSNYEEGSGLIRSVTNSILQKQVRNKKH